MYRMIVVDDEKVERDGVINFLNWESYDIEIVGDAKNGLEGLELIKTLKPDIILTDVKMPLMNGIEMIQEAITLFPDIIFVVISGYGDYEYTSQAMQLGVKYYILKPSDEEKIMKIINKAKAELKERKELEMLELEKYNQEVLKLLPRAKIQFFKSAITNQYLPEDEFTFYEKACIIPEKELFLLVFKGDYSENHLSSFVVENIFEELMDAKDILMKTEVLDHVVFLLQVERTIKLDMVTRQVSEQFKKIFGVELHYAISNNGHLRDVFKMYEETKYRLEKAEGKINKVLDSIYLNRFKQINCFRDMLLEYSAVILIFKIIKVELRDMIEGLIKLMVLVYGVDECYQQCRLAKSEQELFAFTISCLKAKSGITLTDGETKIEKMLLLIHGYSYENSLSIQWLANNIFYINEDYLARVFKTNMKEKIQDYIKKTRMETAKRILEFNKNCLVSELSYYTGYNEDGRYFCKVFKSYFGKTLSEYREEI